MFVLNTAVLNTVLVPVLMEEKTLPFKRNSCLLSLKGCERLTLSSGIAIPLILMISLEAERFSYRKFCHMDMMILLGHSRRRGAGMQERFD